MLRTHWKSASIATGLSMFARLSGALSAVVIAGLFGIGLHTDAYYLALAPATFIIAIVSGSMLSALTPRLMDPSRHKSEDARLLSGAAFGLLCLGLVAYVVLALLWKPLMGLIAKGYPQQTVDLVVLITVALAPFVMFSILSQLMATFLTANKSYRAVVLVPALTPFVVVLGGLWLGNQFGVIILAVGQSLGAAMELLILAYLARKAGAVNFTVPSLAAFQQHKSELWKIAKHGTAISLGMVMVSSTAIIDQIFAATAGHGAISTYAYGTKLYIAVSAVFYAVVAALIAPRLIEKAVAQDWKRLAHLLKTVTLELVAVAALISLVLMLFSRELTELLFVRGEFTTENAEEASRINSWIIWSLPFALAASILGRTLNAMQLTKAVTISSGVLLVTKVVGNMSLVPIFGAPGIAMASIAAYALCATSLALLAFNWISKNDSNSRT
jgi:putative peptidoglycan lipid II flippase